LTKYCAPETTAALKNHHPNGQILQSANDGSKIVGDFCTPTFERKIVEHRALATLIVRVTGLLIIVYAVTGATKSFTPFFTSTGASQPSAVVMVLSVMVVLVVPVLLGLIFIYFPATVTTQILRIEGGPIDAEQIEPLQRVAFSAIGLWLVLFSIIDATYFYGKTRLYQQLVDDAPTYGKMPALLPDDFGGLASCAVQLVIGILLLIGNRGIVNAIGRLRG
jgi:hypothetical protein